MFCRWSLKREETLAVEEDLSTTDWLKAIAQVCVGIVYVLEKLYSICR